jgi:hypothetical protein
LKPVHKEILEDREIGGSLQKKITRFKDPTHKIRRQGKQENFVFTD